MISSRDQKERDKGERIQSLSEKAPAELDPRGIDSKFLRGKQRETDAARYWIERGGTPEALSPEYAAIPITVEMRLWLRIDQDLAGGRDANGYYVRPEAAQALFPEYSDAIHVWLQEHGGARGITTEEFRLKTMRRMLRELASGRAIAHSER